MIQKFKEFFDANRPILKLWGDTVIQEIKLNLESKELDVSVFLKIPVKECRVKDEISAIGKIARKGYDNPQQQMTDLVGARFVVLLTDDLEVLKDIITTNPIWTASKDSDHSDRIESNPELFDYQSIHFVVKANQCELTEKLGIPVGTSCEIQIRTLLQHAYAELTHDNIYKPTVNKVPFQARRLIARSMALMESTDELFCRTIEELKKVAELRNEINARLITQYERLVGGLLLKADLHFNIELLDAFHDRLDKELITNIESFLQARPYVIERIKERAKTNHLYQQPVILFLYWLVKNFDGDTKKTWPYESLRSDLSQIYSDLGIADQYNQ